MSSPGLPREVAIQRFQQTALAGSISEPGICYILNDLGDVGDAWKGSKDDPRPQG